MRILNRPMFRYGGPIREGVMHGMRNNYQSGQLVRPGPGRPGYQGKIPKSKLGAAGWVGKKIPVLKQPIQKLSTSTKDIIPKTWGKLKNIFGSTSNVSKTLQKQGPMKRWYEPAGYTQNISQKVWTPSGWVARDPLFKLGSAAWQGKGYLGKPLKWAGKTIATPTGGIGLLYVGNKWLRPDKTPANENEIKEHLNQGGGKVPGHGDEGMTYTDPSKAEALAKAAQNKRMKSYLNMMGYDSAKKTAMSDALIDASALVQDATSEAGSIKHADWGKLINKAIQTTSKRMDKPEQIREAVGLMATKAAIAKDMSAEENKLNNDYKRMQIALGEKTLAGTSFEEIISDRMIKGDMLKGNDLAALFRIKKGIDAKVISTADMDADQDALAYVTKLIEEKEGTPYPPGYYIISDRIVKVDEQGVNKVL